MKHALSCLIGTSLLFASCASPLKQEAASADVGKTLGVPASDIAFVSYCSFGDAPPSGNHVSFIQGVLALTKTSLVLLSDDLPHAVPLRKIKFAEMRGVDVHHFGRGRQLQVRSETGVLVIEISKNKALVDTAGTEKVREILRQHGVPDWKSDTHYLMKVKTPIIVPIPM